MNITEKLSMSHPDSRHNWRSGLLASASACVLTLSGCGGGGDSAGQDAQGSIERSQQEREAAAHVVPDPSKTVYRITRFGPGAGFVGTALNELGHVGGAYRIDGGSQGGFFFDGVKHMLFATPSGNSPVVKDMNRSDRMTGYTIHQRGDGSTVHEAFTWSKIRGFVRIAPLSPTVLASEAHDINDRGQVVGTMHTPQGEQGFLWSLETGLVTRFGRGTTLLRATHINQAGLIAGVALVNGVERAVLVDSVTGVRRFVAPSSTQGGPASLLIEHLNDRGDVAGQLDGSAFFCSGARGSKPVNVGSLTGALDGTYVQTLTRNGQMLISPQPLDKAFIWNAREGLAEMHANKRHMLMFRSINNHGVAVGVADRPDSVRDEDAYAIAWTKRTGAVDLTTRLQSPQPGVTLRAARAVNDKGQILVVAEGAGSLLLTPVTTNSHQGH